MFPKVQQNVELQDEGRADGFAVRQICRHAETLTKMPRKKKVGGERQSAQLTKWGANATGLFLAKWTSSEDKTLCWFAI